MLCSAESGLEQALQKQTLVNGDLGKPGATNQLKRETDQSQAGRDTSKNLNTPLSHNMIPTTKGPKWQILLGPHSHGLTLQRCQRSLLQREGLRRGCPLGSPCEPQPRPFLPPARSLGEMIQQRPGSQQRLFQPEGSAVSLGSLAALCNQGEVVWGARKMREQSCGAGGTQGSFAAFYWVWKT